MTAMWWALAVIVILYVWGRMPGPGYLKAILFIALLFYVLPYYFSVRDQFSRATRMEGWCALLGAVPVIGVPMANTLCSRFIVPSLQATEEATRNRIACLWQQGTTRPSVTQQMQRTCFRYQYDRSALEPCLQQQLDSYSISYDQCLSTPHIQPR